MSERIQKFLSGLGYGSRREVEEWITDGRLVVNGEPATVGQKISEADAVKFDGKRLSLKAGNEPLRVLLYKKRTGEMVTRDDPEGRRTVFRKLPDLETGRWIAIGRLDVNTSGLLLMTNHGELARRLMHPSFEQHREYAVRALGEVTEDTFDNLRSGVALEDGAAQFQTIRFGDNEVEDDEDGEGEGGGNVKANRWFVVTIAEGRHREVRRLFESQGLIVNRLIRTGYGPIKLGRGIKSGSYREATPEELKRLLDAVNLDPREMLPERVRESHRTKSDYSLHARGEGETAEVPAVQKRGDSKTAKRAEAAVKRAARRENDGARWVKASPVERKLVDRAERRSAGDGERTYLAQAPRAAPDSPWGKPRIALVKEVVDGADAPPQFKAKGFGAQSERSYSERGDRAPTVPTRSYKRDAAESDASESRAYVPRSARKRFGDKPAYSAERKPYGDKPAYASARKSFADKPAYGGGERKPYGERTRVGADEAPRFKPRSDKPSISKPYPRNDGSFKPTFTRDGSDRPAARDGARPAFKPRAEGARDRPGFAGAGRKPYGDRPRSGEGAGFKPRVPSADGGGARAAARFDRKPYGKPVAARAGKPMQRFVVKEGAAIRPGKPKIGLKKKKDDLED